MRERILKFIAFLNETIARSSIAKHLKSKHPFIFRFITNRVAIDKFSGLPLTILSVTIISNIFLLFDFTEDTINSKEFIAIDNFIAKLFFDIRIESVAQGFYYISKLCDIPAVTILGIVLCIYFIIKNKYHFSLGILISILGSGLSIYLGKNIFEIERPHQYAYYHEDYFSFPSGHATISVAFYGLLFYLIIRENVSFKKWGIIISMAFVFWMLIGISRLYLCVHYFSDVIAGYILGFLWLLLSISIIEWKSFKLRNKLR